MIAVRFDFRRLNLWTNALVRAFGLSLALHVVLFTSLEVGHRLGWWKPRGMPRWMVEAIRKKMDQQSLAAKAKDKTQPSIPDVPLVFVAVDPAQTVAEAPKTAKFYSDKNSVAANPDTRLETGTPKIAGTQNKVARTTSAPRPQALPLQPLPGSLEKLEITPELKLALKSETKPAPKVVEAEPLPRASPAPGDLVLTKPRDKSEESVRQTVASVAPAAARVRPRRLADVVQLPSLTAGEKMKQEGGVKRRGVESSLDVKRTSFGAYDAAIVAAIEQRWYDLLDENDYTRGRTGRVVVEFRLTYEGRIMAMRVAENSVGELLGLICQRAVLDPAPFAPWPSDMRRLVGADYREVRFTFYYD